MQFVFDTNDDARIVGCILEIIDDDSLDLRTEGRHQMPDEIMGQGTLFGDLAHEHGNRAAHSLIDINDEYLVIISNKHRATAARWQDCPHLHFDHRFVHQMDGTRPKMKNKRR